MAPEDEPLTLEEAKAHLRVEHSDEDSYIGALISVARQVAEEFTRRVFVTQTWELRLDRFPDSSECPIYVSLPPLQSVTSISYLDTEGVTQVWSALEYIVDSKSEPARITPAYGKTWPTVRNQISPITIRYEAGYGDAEDVPQAIKQAMYLIIGHLYERREASIVGAQPFELPMGPQFLLMPYRCLEFY